MQWLLQSDLAGKQSQPGENETAYSCSLYQQARKCKDNCRSLATQGDSDSLRRHLIPIYKDRFHMVLLGTPREDKIDPQPCFCGMLLLSPLL